MQLPDGIKLPFFWQDASMRFRRIEVYYWQDGPESDDLQQQEIFLK